MKKTVAFKRTFLSLLVGTMGSPHILQAAPLDLVQYPAGSASVEPAPNVIVSVDDSGSMGTAGITALKDALKTTFSASNVPDGRIRLAWQSMNRCSGIPNASSPCSGNNTMKSLGGTHRTNFLTWVDTLTASGWTPSFPMVRAAGEYLRTTGANSPWNKTPGTVDPSPMTCRKAYHIFMTDGEWNGANGTAAFADADRMTQVRILNGANANLDGSPWTLPDGKAYSPTSDQTRVYRDNWGYASFTAQRRTRACSSCAWTAWTDYTDNNGMNTLADLAFRDWATDLQPGIANEMVPIINKSGDETFGSGLSATTLQEYWNPKNNPATWQNMVTYSIGFNNAANLSIPSGTAGDWPAFASTGAIDERTHAGDFWRIVTGEKQWPTPFCGTSGNMPCESQRNTSLLEENRLNNPTARNEYTDGLISRARMYELWHMAINGRGKFMPATNSTELATAFKKILNQIIEDTSTPITGFASSSSTFARSDVGAFVSGYDANGWKGFVRSDRIAKTTGTRSANPDWGIKPAAPPNDRVTTADKLDALTAADITSRVILTTNDSTNKGVVFEWEAGTTKLSTTQKNLMKDGGTDEWGEKRVNFIRGDRTFEGTTAAAPFRVRTSRQGDIVNSGIWYVAEPSSGFSLPGYSLFTKNFKNRNPMIYVGGNDGMLHGFSAKDGQERLAFVPKGVIANLPELSKPGYNHRYYVDGSPYTGDVNWGITGSPDWRTLLVGSLGAGGKGYFMLDVTRPGSTDGSIVNTFTKANAASLVVLDQTWHKDDTVANTPTNPEADIGHIFGEPVMDDTNAYKVTQITRMNNGKWAVVMGNGYNSKNERPVLLIQFVDGATGDFSLQRIVAASTGTNATANGLSAPRLVDINSDGMPDLAYAGDLKGNLWKFDLSSASTSDWGVAFGGSPLYTAAYTSGGSTSPQPITTVPSVRPNDRYLSDGTPVGGMMVAFGTGRNVTEGDRTDTSKQTIYSVLDNTRYKLIKTGPNKDKIEIDTAVTPTVVGTGTAQLVEQKITGGSKVGSGISSGRSFWEMTQNAVDFSAKKGWYFHLPEEGERLLKPMIFHDNSNMLMAWTQIPASGGNTLEETCKPSPKEEKQFLTLMNIVDGKRASVQLLDKDGDTFYNDSDDKVSRQTTPKGSKSIMQTPDGKTDITNADGTKDAPIAPMPESPMRPSWRQLQ
ncbi:pilus assembly protein [Simplicispira sedimenti]|uniref:pilus assembly protein n=1 Tax=Simplicispira sedimenti TaxID=2919500 RepID=UPI001FAAA9C5|nr:PilC/PilY family type IV pilus protein [Acidovorax sp. W1-6]